jgi:branched-chain amino acid aminotransferase
MTTLVNLDGKLLPPHEARISVFDRGFLYGDSIYESLRTYERVPFLFERHLTRLERSASRLGIAIEGGIERVLVETHRLVAACGEQETTIRIVVTRGGREGVVDLDPETSGPSRLVLIGREAKPFPASLYETGVDGAIVDVVRNRRDALDPAVKSGNYLNNVMAIGAARRSAAFESVMLNSEGFVTEASTSNLFVVKDSVLLTPAFECGLLDGVTRGVLFEIAARHGIAFREAKLRAADLLAADEVFLTSSLKEVMPVKRIGDHVIGSGRPGPSTKRLLALYRERIAEETAAARDPWNAIGDRAPAKAAGVEAK